MQFLKLEDIYTFLSRLWCFSPVIYEIFCLLYPAGMLACHLDQNSFNTTTSEATGGHYL